MPNKTWSTSHLFTKSSLIIALMTILFSSNAEVTQPQGAAPDFKLQDQNGQWHELSDYCGQWTVLYFYPKDDTPGCTTEACEFRDEVYAYRKNNIKLIGISLDDVDSHKEFADKYNLPFTLLSDTNKSAANQYGVLKNKLGFKYTSRETFIVDPEGNVAKHYKKVTPEGHAVEVLEAITSLSAKR